MNTLQKYRNPINQLCRQFKVKKLYAFGSVVNDNFREDSDIVMLVDFDVMKEEDYADNYFDLKFSLEDLLHRPVDLLEEKAVHNPYLRKAIDLQKELIYR
ncbi:MAG: nucleotidyltransferase domain-containing protein [Chitinophagales bacterium]|nr:nucleotidyltransferase domain-containing protein [Chitinophagales bacterium]